jgi:twitching motility two-component system response regulator PilH
LARKILLADDSVTAQNMGRKILTDAGYEVIAVNNGSAALKKIIELKPDLIVLDVYMPGYSGLEVCQRIKDNRDTARIPVLLTVGKLEPFKPEEARRARADAFVVKPFEASELLTAISKLEEKIAPQPEPYKQGRFAKAVASVDEAESTTGEKFGDSDSGWKSRIRFPGRKKHVEPEEAPEVPVASKAARDFREAPIPTPPVAPVSSVPNFERPIPAGIPRDITPEEIAAISAAAARLSGAAGPEVVETSAAPALQPSSAATATPIEESQALASASEPGGIPDFSIASDIAPITFASAPGLGEEQPAGEKWVEEKSGREETHAETALEKILPDIAISEPATPLMESAVPAIDSAVISREPVFTVPEFASAQTSSSELTAALETPQSPEVEQTVVAEVASVAQEPTVAQSEQVAKIHAAAPAEIQVPAQSEVQSAASPAAESESQPEVPAAFVPPTTEVIQPHESAVIAAPAPHDEEVMAALQNLIPAPGSDDAADSAQKAEAPSGMVASVAEFAHAGVPVFRPRWIAEEAVLTAEEAALSLEQEMEKAYSAFAATEAARMLATSATDSLAVPVSSSAAAGLTPAMAAEPLPSHNFAITAPATEFTPALAVSDAASNGSPESEAVHALASAAAVGDGGAVSISVPATPETLGVARDAQTPVSPEPLTGESVPALETHTHVAEDIPSRAVVTDFVVAASAAREAISEAELAVPGSASVAFEPAPSQDAIPAEPANTKSYQLVQEEPGEPFAASADASQEMISAGGTDSMAKNSESLGFKMIRQSPAGTKSGPVAPVTKENFDAPATPAAEPVAMAAAASAEAAPAIPPMPATAPDPRAIASIVDSVLAELRPKIVEEIAKKLAEPQK